MEKFNVNKVRGKRKELGLTQTDMAELIGISNITFFLKEKGEREFTITELEKIAEITHEPIKYFFTK